MPVFIGGRRLPLLLSPVVAKAGHRNSRLSDLGVYYVCNIMYGTGLHVTVYRPATLADRRTYRLLAFVLVYGINFFNTPSSRKKDDDKQIE